MRRRYSVLLSLFFLGFFADAVLAKSEPQKITQQLFYDVLQVVRQNNLTDRQKSGTKLLERYFDFSTFAEWTMEDHWSRLSDNQRRAFLQLFKKRFYERVLEKISRTTNKKFLLKMISKRREKEYVELKYRLKHNGHRTPFSLMWIKKNDSWRLVDVTIAKANLVAKYQGQFNKIIRDYGFEELLDRLEKGKLDKPTH